MASSCGCRRGAGEHHERSRLCRGAGPVAKVGGRGPRPGGRRTSGYPGSSGLSRAALSFTYTLADLGTFTGRSGDDLANWGINDKGNVVGLHGKLNLLHGNPGYLLTDGGGYVLVDWDGNGFYDGEYGKDKPGRRQTHPDERRFVGFPHGGHAARVQDINNNGLIASLRSIVRTTRPTSPCGTATASSYRSYRRAATWRSAGWSSTTTRTRT